MELHHKLRKESKAFFIIVLLYNLRFNIYRSTLKREAHCYSETMKLILKKWGWKIPVGDKPFANTDRQSKNEFSVFGRSAWQ